MGQTRVAVTGSQGFIGQNVTRILSSCGDIKQINFEGDLLVQDDIISFFENNKEIDSIIHLVGVFSGPTGLLIDINVKTLANLLETAKDYGVKKVVFTSTGAVYGEPIGEESFETDQLSPNTEYSMSKMLAEETLKYYCRQYHMSYVILRYPNVYGRGNEKGVIGAFMKSIQENHSITVYGDGEQSRNFLHVDDACRAIELGLRYEGSDIFNISNPIKYTINEVVELYKKKFDFSVERKPSNNNLRDLLLNTEKAHKLLRFDVEHKEIEL